MPKREDDIFAAGRPEIKATLEMQPVHVKDLKNIKQIGCGQDHFIALDNTGKLWAMGDDTFGQCGQGGEGRSMVAPFFEKRFGKPVLVPLEARVEKIICGYRHNLAITTAGKLFGWGYNNQQ